MKTWHEKDIERLAEFLFENSLDMDIAENLENAVDVAIMSIEGLAFNSLHRSPSRGYSITLYAIPFGAWHRG